MICGRRREIGWKLYAVPARVSIPSGSMTNGGFVSAGARDWFTMSKSSTTIKKSALLHNPHAGEILLEEFLKPMSLSQSAMARAIGVPPRRINEIVLGKRAVTADTDLRLARYFGVSEGLFLGLQADFELMEQKRKLGDVLARIVPRAA
jgi:addiction module HigA family antidote